MSQFRPFVAGLDPSVDIFEEPRESLMTPAQTANVAGGFADPLGLVDIFGMYPEFPERGVSVEEMAMGPRSPSLLENIQNRDYLNSILQLAGVVPGAAGTSKALRQALRAYHGTPHRFPAAQRVRNKMSGETFVAELDNPVHRSILEGKFGGTYELVGEPSDLGLFDMNRLGQGEGAQAFGRGLYFSGAEGIAKDYRENLTGITQRMLDNLPNMEIGKQAGSGRYALYNKETGFLDTDYPSFATEKEAQEYIDNPPTGALYSVDLDVDEAMLLDYDAPLIDQYFKVTDAVFETPFVKKLVKAMEDRGGYVDMAGDVLDNRGVDFPEDADIYALLENSTIEDIENFASNFPEELGGPEQRAIDLAKQLREAGVPGISYEAGRHSGYVGDDIDKAKNYVIFDDELIKIVDRKREGGAVMQPFIPGLDPTIDIFDDPRDAEPLLTPAQAANVGGGFADPLGLVDIFGGYPAFPSDEMSVEEMLAGPRSPSLMENLRQGEYLDAALQAAGVIPIVGTAAKGLRTARAGIRALPIDEQIKAVGSIRESGHQGGSVFAPDLYQQTGVEDVRRAEQALKSNQSDLQSIDQMVERAEAVNPDFQANIADVAANAGAKKADKFITLRDGSQFDVEVKTRKSIDDKIQRKGLTPDQFTDGVRTSVYVDSADQAEQVASEIGRLYPSIDRGWQILPETGYFDRKMNVAITDPNTGGVIIGEVQIKTPEMAEAGEVGHRWYEITRKLEGRYNKDIPPQKYKTYVDARAEQQRIYGGATQAADPTIVDLLLEKFRLGGLVAR